MKLNDFKEQLLSISEEINKSVPQNQQATCCCPQTGTVWAEKVPWLGDRGTAWSTWTVISCLRQTVCIILCGVFLVFFKSRRGKGQISSGKSCPAYIAQSSKLLASNGSVIRRGSWLMSLGRMDWWSWAWQCSALQHLTCNCSPAWRNQRLPSQVPRRRFDKSWWAELGGCKKQALLLGEVGSRGVFLLCYGSCSKKEKCTSV